MATNPPHANHAEESRSTIASQDGVSAKKTRVKEEDAHGGTKRQRVKASTEMPTVGRHEATMAGAPPVTNVPIKEEGNDDDTEVLFLGTKMTAAPKGDDNKNKKFIKNLQKWITGVIGESPDTKNYATFLYEEGYQTLDFIVKRIGQFEQDLVEFEKEKRIRRLHCNALYDWC